MQVFVVETRSATRLMVAAFSVNHFQATKATIENVRRRTVVLSYHNLYLYHLMVIGANK